MCEKDKKISISAIKKKIEKTLFDYDNFEIAGWWINFIKKSLSSFYVLYNMFMQDHFCVVYIRLLNIKKQQGVSWLLSTIKCSSRLSNSLTLLLIHS